MLKLLPKTFAASAGLKSFQFPQGTQVLGVELVAGVPTLFGFADDTLPNETRDFYVALMGEQVTDNMGVPVGALVVGSTLAVVFEKARPPALAVNGQG